MENELFKYIKNELSLHIHHLEFMKRSESCFAVASGKSHRKVPYLRLFFFEDGYRLAIGEPERMGLVKPEIAEKIREYLESLQPEEEYYDKQMYIGAQSWDRDCYCDFAYKEKPLVERILIEQLGTAPRDIFACSTPGLNIVYETPAYESYSLATKAEKISAELNRAALDFLTNKYGPGLSPNLLEVTLWHPQMPGYSGYGLARED